MDTGLYASAASLSLLSRMQDSVAHNLAQTSTTAFKRRVTSVGSFESQLRMGENAMPIPRMAESIDFSQGQLVPTENPLDLAIENPPVRGSGFLRLETREGARYVRGGTFVTTADGGLATLEGDRLAIRGGRLDPSAPVSVDAAGRITQPGRAVSARLALVDFDDLTRLSPDKGGRYRADAPERPSLATIRSGFLERSNISPVDSLVNLVVVSRAFETSTRVMRTLDETLQRASTFGS